MSRYLGFHFVLRSSEIEGWLQENFVVARKFRDEIAKALLTRCKNIAKGLQKTFKGWQQDCPKTATRLVRYCDECRQAATYNHFTASA